MKVKSFFGKLFVSGLLLGGCLVFTSPHQEVQASFTHNINAQKAFKLSDKYVKNFDKKLSQGVYDRSDLRNVNLSKESTRKALRNQVLMLLAYDLNYGIDGYNTVGEVSNAITIHYDDTEYMDEFGIAGQYYKIVSGGENTLIANLVLNFVQGIGDKYLMHEKVNDKYYPIVEENNETLFYSSDILNGIEYFPILLENNIEFILLDDYMIDKNKFYNVIETYCALRNAPNDKEFISKLRSVGDVNSIVKTTDGFLNKKTVYKVKDYEK